MTKEEMTKEIEVQVRIAEKKLTEIDAEIENEKEVVKKYLYGDYQAVLLGECLADCAARICELGKEKDGTIKTLSILRDLLGEY